MKFNKFCILTVGVLLGLSSCGEGQYWDEASNPQPVYAFAKLTESISVGAWDAAPSTVNVTVNRNNAGAAITVPVTLAQVNASGAEVTNDTFSGSSEVTFEAGKTSAVYTINVVGSIDPGNTYYAKVTLENENPEDNQTPVEVKAERLSYTVAISKEIVWEDAGTAATFTSMTENEEAIDIPVQYAANVTLADGNKMMRLVSPYWYLWEEEDSKGANFTFYVDADNNAVSFPGFQATGFKVSGYPFYFGCPASMGCSFTNEGDVFTLDGIFAYAVSGSLYPYDYEFIQFTWSDYSK